MLGTSFTGIPDGPHVLRIVTWTSQTPGSLSEADASIVNVSSAARAMIGRSVIRILCITCLLCEGLAAAPPLAPVGARSGVIGWSRLYRDGRGRSVAGTVEKALKPCGANPDGCQPGKL